MALTHVGQFTSPTTTGSQAITGCGFTPVAVIFYAPWVDQTTGWSANSQFCVGVATASGAAYTAFAGEDAHSRSAEQRRWNVGPACGIVHYDDTLINEATLTSFNSDGFVLNWTTVNPTPMTYNYMAIGGGGITNAAVVAWQGNNTTSNQSVTTVGFQPDMVFHLSTGSTGTSPTTETSSYHSLGAMDRAGNQWAEAGFGVNYSNPTSTGRYQITNACIALVAPGAIAAQASYVAMLSNGFEVNWSVATSTYFISLCLKGGQYQVGHWSKSTASQPVTDTITATSIVPTGMLFVSDSYIDSGPGQAGDRLMVGASDGTNELTCGITNENGASNTSVIKKYQRNDRCCNISDNDTQTDSAAAYAGFAYGAVSVTWALNNAVATQICYILFGVSLITPSSSETATLTVSEAKSVSSGITSTETATLTAHSDVPTIAINPSSAETANLNLHEADSASSGAYYFGNSMETGTLTAHETITIPSLAVTSVESAHITAHEQSIPLVSGNLFIASSEESGLNAVEYNQVARTKAPPGINGGTGRIWFGGVDITEAPYYAGMTLESKYGFLDGYTSQQYTTSPNKLVITRPYAKDWLRHVVLRSIAPDNSRETLMKSIVALAELFDPTNGPQQLMFEEYIGSYFIAQSQTSILNNEATAPQMTEIDIDLACTGPAYSVQESYALASINSRTKWITITSNGDVPAWPRWGVYCGGEYDGSFSITNETTGESITWTGQLNFGDYIEFIMDEEYGTPYQIIINGDWQALSGFSGPAWPHLIPGDNTILFTQLKGRQDFLLLVNWRDRFEVGQTDYPAPPSLIPPIIRMPVNLTIEGKDNPALMNSYLLSGTLLDIYANPIPYAPITISYTIPVGNWAPGNWINWNVVTTDENGNWTAPPTGSSLNANLIRAYYAGDATHTQRYSDILQIAPPSMRTPTTLTCAQTGADPTYTFSGQYLDYNSTPIAGAVVGLYGSANSIMYGANYNNDYQDYWRLTPDAAENPVVTDKNGSYSFTINIGCANPWGMSPRYYHPYTYGTMRQQAAVGNLAGFEIGETAAYAPEEPQSIEYQIMLPPEAITNGLIQYFAANGFTTCYLIADQGSNANNYATELAIIKALGMKPILDMEMIVGQTWDWGAFTDFEPYFIQMAAAGWEYVSSEAGWRVINGGANQDCVAFVRQYFKGFINYHINRGEMTFGYGVGDPHTTPPGGASPPIGGIYIDQGTTANVWECYSDDMMWRAIMPGTDASAVVGISCGILAGAWAASWNEVWINSLANTAPIQGVNTSTGNTYQSIMDWSYGAGVGLSYFAIDASWPAAFYNYNDMGFPGLITDLQSSYPPAGTNNLIAPTILAANLTLSESKNTDSTYTFTGQLTELVSQNALVNAPVRLDISVDDATWTPVGGIINPAYSDATGTVTWDEVSLGARPSTTLSSQAVSGQNTLVVTSPTGFIGYHSKYDGTMEYSSVDSTDTIALDPSTFIQFYNGSGTDDTIVCSASQADVHGKWWCQTCDLPAGGGELLLGPFDMTKYNGSITVTHSSTTGVVMASFTTTGSIEPSMLVNISDGTNSETHMIQSINVDTITLTDGLANTFAAGATVQGVYVVRAYYAGDATHLPFYAPNGYANDGLMLDGVPRPT